MDVQLILAECTKSGIRLRVDGDSLKAEGRRDAMTPELVEILQTNKAKLIFELRRNDVEHVADHPKEVASAVAQGVQAAREGDRGGTVRAACRESLPDIRGQGGQSHGTGDRSVKLDQDVIAKIRAGNAVRVPSNLLGEAVWWVRDSRMAEDLKRQGIPEVCYTLAELRELAGKSPEFLGDIHRWKREFGARLAPALDEEARGRLVKPLPDFNGGDQ